MGHINDEHDPLHITCPACHSKIPRPPERDNILGDKLARDVLVVADRRCSQLCSVNGHTDCNKIADISAVIRMAAQEAREQALEEAAERLDAAAETMQRNGAKGTATTLRTGAGFIRAPKESPDV